MAVFFKENPSETKYFPAKIDSFQDKFCHGTIKVEHSMYVHTIKMYLESMYLNFKKKLNNYRKINCFIVM